LAPGHGKTCRTEARVTFESASRELANVIERTIVMGRGPQITLQDLSPVIASKAPDAIVDGLPYREALDACRQQIIVRALSQTQGNRAAAAKLLDIERRHLLRLMKCFGIQ
jgi:DNA-binding NtrC family response regulator